MVDIVPRGTWRMPGPLGPARVSAPCRGLWLHHAAGSYRDDLNLKVHDDVYADARSVARTGVDRFGRASYSWFTSPASPRGQVLEMQGHWIGAHTAKQNSSSHALCVMGNFQLIEPSDDLLWTVAATSATGFLEGWWSQPELLGGHRDAPGAATACPGSHLHDAIPDINRLARELAQEDDMPLTDEDLDRIARRLFEQPLIHADDVSVLKALDRTYRAGQHNVAALNQLLSRDGMDTAALAADIADVLDDDLAAAVADELNRRLAG